MILIEVLWYLAGFGAVAALGLMLITTVRIAVFRFHPRPFRPTSLEHGALIASILAVLASALYFHIGWQPETIQISVQRLADGTTAYSRSVAEPARLQLEWRGKVEFFLFLVIPLMIAMLAWSMKRTRTRPIVYGFCALLMVSQSAVGMSGYGLLYVPAALFLLLAGACALLKPPGCE
ncbi:hypothetical protein EHN06_08870 [Marinobacter sp. NP-4(2019)]|uniref:hypothetical protein n=1 Tax=Marinobacter sp. NP-4(2019) TaxID=2488665 RepID=UPI000FC3E2B0|nr:hypothetical protein [Marinobacter sp. NP-4(2019)]AZT83642.1 hypothetical protein EHN06_08870 [Marinobacter sp. NP-4(2019)]